MNQKQRRLRTFITVAGLYTLLTACATWQSLVREIKGEPVPNRGILVNHELHAAEGLDCSDCHEMSAGQRMSFVDHDTCSVCHEFPEVDLADASRFVDEVSCKKCHTRDDFSAAPQQQFIADEIKFDHQVHATAEVSCATCHEEPDRPRHYSDGLMAECMDCHQQPSYTFASLAETTIEAAGFSANECSVCHRELTKDTIPKFRHGQRIAHDSAQAWTRLHGQESYLDATYCATCHVEEEDCMTCHRVMKPDNHTLAWNQRLHGAHAQWNSQSCAACHEEDSCAECHQHTEPRSHRAGFGTPSNNHCVQCHFPVESSCAVCHESVEHRTAPRTPHDADGGEPGNCALCHPGGVAGAAPHRFNASVSCLACHG
jgi:hypothetical protein